MARKLTIGINWQGKLDFNARLEHAKIADQAGIHSIWVAEAWGRDAFTLLALGSAAFGLRRSRRPAA